jgi:hypothetical protein
MFALGACSGDFDQRRDEARTIGPGQGSTGTIANPNTGLFVRGVASVGGSVVDAFVTLRPINPDASVNWDDASILGTGTTFGTGVYQVSVNDGNYRGPILVEVRGGGNARGGNPATAISQKFHTMRSDHAMYSVVPVFEGYSVTRVDVSPFTTIAVARCLAFDGSIAGVNGGIAAGMFGLVCQQVAEYFGLDRVREVIPNDYAASGVFGNSDLAGRVMAALSQLARNIGVANVFDFYAGLWLDTRDDGVLNGSIGLVPGTPAAMPDLSAPGILGAALHDDFMDPFNLERVTGGDNTQIATGGAVDLLITHLDSIRDINDAVRAYELVLRIETALTIAAGGVHATRIIALDRIGSSIEFHPYGDSAGPSFVEFAWVSSAPAVLSVQDYGRITVDASAPAGHYTLSLTVQPAAGQTFVTGPVTTYTINIYVP